ncbi:acyltransferase [Peribacillus frigoritolerans]|uniref:acyltransferase n=1 Tax=Peribacillus frigoritolerans TaxID=450367 RepID=UPI000FDC4725|nr:acyltransferase [Peribacillus frigoritolerans]AZV63422.1 acyltransferase [Peribacillus frigoritolerans]
MIIYKIFNHLKISIVLLFYKILFRNKLKLGKNISFRKNFNIIIENSGDLKIGDNCFFNNNCSISCLGEINIGSNTIFGENVKMYDHNHKYKNPEQVIMNQGFQIGKIKIGNNCWIGSNVIILNNVEIGNNVVIGANSLIYKSIPDNSLVKSRGQISIEKLYKRE